MEVKDKDRYGSFTRRTAIMSVGAFGVMGALFSRLYYLQIVKSSEYALLAEDNRLNIELLAPLRGRIYDRFGVELATNRKNFQVVLVPEKTESVEAVLDKLAEVIEISDAQKRKVLRTAARQRKFNPITVVDNLSWEEFARVNVHSPSLAGIKPDAGVTRYYPFGPNLAHVVGYVAPVSENEIGDDRLLSLPGFRVGKSGIERRIESELRGKAGNRQVEVNAYGKVIREVKRTEGEPGKNAVLTLDMELQNYAMDRLKGESAASVVLDIETGDVLVLASAPGFDPNAFNRGLSQELWDSLNTDEHKPLLNKTIAGQYPPGSTFKMITALAALESGLMSPDDYIFCSGQMRLGNHLFHCWKRGGHGALRMRNAIKHSCDIFFYEAAKRAGIDRIERMAKKFGLGQSYDFDVPGEKPGLVPGKGWKIANMGEPWQLGETLITGIGQGFLLATPLQMAVMAARLANGGRMIRPRVIRSIGMEPVPRPEVEMIRVPRAHLEVIYEGMNAVSNEIGGTAYRSRIPDKGMELAGKTGTAQVRRITRAERAAGVIKNEDLPWNRRDHAWFIAYAPVRAPRYAISVFVEHGGGGSKVAAPIARDIMRRTLLKDPVRQEAIGPIASGQRIRPLHREEG